MSTETKQQHTPGPWKAIDGAIVAADGSIVVNTLGAMRGSGDTHADEALIAAAPDLLAVAEAVIKEHNGRNHSFNCAKKSGGDCDCAVGLAWAAIAKAKGGED